MNLSSEHKTSQAINFSLIALLLLFIGSIGGLYTYETEVIEEALIKEQQAEASLTREHLENVNATLYQGLRTIARLPSTRALEQTGHKYDSLSQQTIQEIYNNLYAGVRLSEVYIVSLGFDPEYEDKNRDAPGSNIITFDEFIVGKTLSHKNSPQSASVEEIEIEEYRVMRQQMDWFKKNTPVDSNIKALDYPLLISTEVITCDNSLLTPHRPNDHDRSGLVFSVPYFGQDGKLSGMVSGVLLIRILENHINKGNYILTNDKEELKISSAAYANYKLSKKPQKIVSTGSLPVDLNDNWNNWKLQFFILDADISSYAHLQTEKTLWQINAAISILAGSIALLMFWLLKRQRAKTLVKNKSLEESVYKRTRELNDANIELRRMNQVKNDFISRISQELRTPINAIIGYSDLVREGLKSNNIPKYETDVQRINDVSAHLLTLIDEIREITKMESESSELIIDRIEIRDIVTTVFDKLQRDAEEKNTQLIFETENDKNIIETDWQRTEHILFNLVENAVKFTENGSVTIKVHTDQNNVVFDIIDTGIGMDEEKSKNIFKEFYQINPDHKHSFIGTGLGLPICRGLTTLLGGSISFTSSPGKGTHFILKLPRTFNHAAPIYR